MEKIEDPSRDLSRDLSHDLPMAPPITPFVDKVGHSGSSGSRRLEIAPGVGATEATAAATAGVEVEVDAITATTTTTTATSGGEAHASIPCHKNMRANRIRNHFAMVDRLQLDQKRWQEEHGSVSGMSPAERRALESARKTMLRSSRERAQQMMEWSEATFRELGATEDRPEMLPDYVPRLRLEFWGRCIRTQRQARRMRAGDFSKKLGISDATLRRVEHGDPGVSALTYLLAMSVLEILMDLVPEPAEDLWYAADPFERRKWRRRDVPF